MTEIFEMEDRTSGRTEEDPVDEETNIDLPEVPVGEKSSDELSQELVIEQFISSIRKGLKCSRNLDKIVYKRLTTDKEGYLYYNNKRITIKGGKKLLSVKTLLRNPDAREFLEKIGYAGTPEPTASTSRDLGTVAPTQTDIIKTKVESFRITEEWAKKEQEKAERQLLVTSDEAQKKTSREAISYYDQMQTDARARYKEVAQNQLKRINEIISDKSRSLGERLRELFRRDGLTIGAVITALGMTISTIALALKALFTPASSPSNNPAPKPTGPNPIQQALVKLSNFLLDLAKKALTSLPGIIGSILGFIFKKAGEIVLFLSEHLLLLFVAITAVILESIFSYINMRRPEQEH